MVKEQSQKKQQQTTPQRPAVKPLNFKRNFIGLVLGLIGAFFFTAARKFGVLTTFKNFPEGNPTCQYNEQKLVGPEDMTKIRENIAIGIGNDNLMMWDMGGVQDTPRGKIWVYYFDTKTLKVIEAENFPQENRFQPHGIFFDPDTEKLHVLNHPYQGLGDRIEVFQLNTENINDIKISLVETLQLPQSINGNGNDIVYLAKNNEYLVSEWIAYPDDLHDSRRTSPSALFKKVKTAFNTALSRRYTNVYSCVSNENKNLECLVIKSASGELNNGITWDFKNQIFVADTVAKRIAVYDLDLQAERSQRLVFKENIRTDCFPDNVEYDRYLNQIMTGGFGQGFQFFTETHRLKKTHPVYNQVDGVWSVVDRIKINENKYVFENILTRDDVYRGLSSALEYKGEIIIGSFIDKSISSCKIDGVNPNKPFTHTVISFFKSIAKKIIPI